MSTVYLYKYREYIHLLQDDKNVPNINMPMIIYDTKIYKGVTNTIDFVIRNNDRKPISMVGYTMIAQIREVDNPSGAKNPTEILLEKNVTMVDERTGKAKLVLDPEDIQDWETGYYRFNIRTIDQNGQLGLLFTDINKETWCSFELIEGISSSMVPAVEILGSDFTPTPVGYTYDTKWVTGALPGDAQAQRASGTHTIVAYTTSWQGKIWIEGSLSNNAPLPSEWFYIPLDVNHDYIELTDQNNQGPKLINFTMNLYWLRVSYQPSSMNKGKFDKILYKT